MLMSSLSLCWFLWFGAWFCGLPPLKSCGMFSPSSSSSSGGGGGVVGTSQSSVGGTTHLSDLLSKTNMAGHLWSRGYPPWHCQYLLQDFPRGTFPLASSLQRAVNKNEPELMKNQ